MLRKQLQKQGKQISVAKRLRQVNIRLKKDDRRQAESQTRSLDRNRIPIERSRQASSQTRSPINAITESVHNPRNIEKELYAYRERERIYVRNEEESRGRKGANAIKDCVRSVSGRNGPYKILTRKESEKALKIKDIRGVYEILARRHTAS